MWQTKGENGDVGDPVMGIVNAENDHTNIVDIKRNDNLDLMTNPLTGKDQEVGISWPCSLEWQRE
ncbi:MAG: hypothetical protein ACLVEJ_14635 [Parabacteroides sp.]